MVEVSLASGALEEIECDVLAVTAPARGPLSGPAAAIDQATGGLIAAAVEQGAFQGALYDSEWLYPAPGVKARRVLVVGTGKSSDYDLRLVRNVAGVASRQAAKKGAKRVVLALTPPDDVSADRLVEITVDGALTALQDSALYKENHKSTVDRLAVYAADNGSGNAGLERGQKIAAGTNLARWLGDEPSNIMTTLRFAEEARKMAAANGLECEVLDEAQIREAGMNLLLSVAQGSQYPPSVVVLRYNGGGESAPIAFVGKGVTFDSGGISIKPAENMHYMKYDMCGAASVIGVMQALSQLGAKVNAIGIAGLVENMPGGRATRPGDIIRAANGKTVEIINTDAEGRLVLADALDLAIKRGADRLVDIATLTGAIKVALGDVTTGFFAAPQSWADQVSSAAERVGERAWQMPLYPDYKDNLKSNIADLMNTGGRWGGSCNAAVFLQQFVADKPWAHLDVAATAWTEKDRPWQMKGATGVMVRTMIELAESSASES